MIADNAQKSTNIAGMLQKNILWFNHAWSIVLVQIFIAGLGGFLGSAARFWIASLSYRLLGQDFPYGTLIVNVVGCFLIGFLMTVFEQRFLITPNLRIFLTIGILGGFTTFSSF